jgi:hypothetical protein
VSQGGGLQNNHFVSEVFVLLFLYQLPQFRPEMSNENNVPVVKSLNKLDGGLQFGEYKARNAS